MRALAQYVLSVLTNPGDDNHYDMERILYAALDLRLVEYNEKDELVKKEIQ